MQAALPFRLSTPLSAAVCVHQHRHTSSNTNGHRCSGISHAKDFAHRFQRSSPSSVFDRGQLALERFMCGSSANLKPEPNRPHHRVSEEARSSNVYGVSHGLCCCVSTSLVTNLYAHHDPLGPALHLPTPKSLLMHTTTPSICPPSPHFVVGGALKSAGIALYRPAAV